MYKLLLAIVLSTAAAQTLETFDGSRQWSETNDPVTNGVAPARYRYDPHRSPLTARRPRRSWAVYPKQPSKSAVARACSTGRVKLCPPVWNQISAA